MEELKFSMTELLKSDTANKYKISNIPNGEEMNNLLNLIYYVLQPLRIYLNKPVIITSGYRCAKVNKLVGGAVDSNGNPKSQHCKGQAADFHVNGLTIAQLIDKIKKSGIEYDQLINEYNKWVHISFAKGKNRKQCFKIS